MKHKMMQEQKPYEASASVQVPFMGQTAKEIVRSFLLEVRSGKCPERAAWYMAETVQAHQVKAETAQTVLRTPQDYTDHILEFKAVFGDFDFEITELIAEGDRVYARWVQQGIHQGELDGYAPTGLPLTECSGAVYQITHGKIAAYWLQTDRMGMDIQLQQNAAAIAAETNG